VIRAHVPRQADLFYDIPDILEQGEAFVGLVDLPPVADVLERVAGPDVRCWQASPQAAGSFSRAPCIFQ
jgi:hypothetical protein